MAIGSRAPKSWRAHARYQAMAESTAAGTSAMSADLRPTR